MSKPSELPRTIDSFWYALGSQQEYYEVPDIVQPDPVYRIRTKPGKLFDDCFWDAFHKFEDLHICHIAYYGPARSEDVPIEDPHGLGYYELRFIERKTRIWWDD